MISLMSASLERAGAQAGLRHSERILFHLLQEYARHLGHLDIVSELAEGQIGE